MAPIRGKAKQDFTYQQGGIVQVVNSLNNRPREFSLFEMVLLHELVAKYIDLGAVSKSASVSMLSRTGNGV